MIRTVTVAALLIAGVTVVRPQNVQITSVDQCNQTATTLDGMIKSSLAAARAVEQAQSALERLRSACTAGDLTTASNEATNARGILAVE